MKIVAIHQPEYLPVPSYVDKARTADVFVFLDDVQFNRSSLQQRAKIVREGKLSWLTIPFIHHFPQKIDEVETAEPWCSWHLDILRESYNCAPYFKEVFPALERFLNLVDEHEGSKLVDAAVQSACLLFEVFGVDAELVSSSQLGAEGYRGARVLDVCKKLGATHYLSGKSGSSYLDRETFVAAGIEVIVQEFEVPRYRMGLPEDIRGLSIVDAWMHLGVEKTKEVLGWV